MSLDKVMIQFGLIAAVIVLAATLYGVVALWAARGRSTWFWRSAAVLLLLAAVAPIGAYELLAIYGTQAAVVVGGIWMVRLLRAWQARRDVATDLRAIQFRLPDLLKATLLAAAVFAIV